LGNHNVTGSAQGGAVVVGGGISAHLVADDGTVWDYGGGGTGLGGGGFTCDSLTGWLDTDPVAVGGVTTFSITVTALGVQGQGQVTIDFGVGGDVGHVSGTVASGAIAYSGAGVGGFTSG
jgi:hypothetical protein